MDKEDIVEGVKVTFILIGIAMLLIAVIMIPMYIMDRWDCTSYERVTGRDTKYAALQCYVQDDHGKYRAMDEMKIRNATKGE